MQWFFADARENVLMVALEDVFAPVVAGEVVVLARLRLRKSASDILFPAYRSHILYRGVTVQYRVHGRVRNWK